MMVLSAEGQAGRDPNTPFFSSHHHSQRLCCTRNQVVDALNDGFSVNSRSGKQGTITLPGCEPHAHAIVFDWMFAAVSRSQDFHKNPRRRLECRWRGRGDVGGRREHEVWGGTARGWRGWGLLLRP